MLSPTSPFGWCGSIRLAHPGDEPRAVARRRRGLCRVPPLAVPSEQSGETVDILKAAAVLLFVARARAIEPSFAVDDASIATIAAICRRLDGIPSPLKPPLPDWQWWD